MPPALESFDEDDILAPEVLDIAPSRKRSPPSDLQDGTFKRTRTHEPSAVNDASLDLTLDSLTTLLLDKPEHPLYKRNIQHAIDCVSNEHDLRGIIGGPLEGLNDAVKKRCSGKDHHAEQRLLSSLSKVFAERVLLQLGQGLVNTFDVSSHSSGVRTSVSADGYKLELRVTPILSLDDSDEEARPAKSLEPAAGNSGHVQAEAGTLASFSGRQTGLSQRAHDDSGVNLTGEDEARVYAAENPTGVTDAQRQRVRMHANDDHEGGNAQQQSAPQTDSGAALASPETSVVGRDLGPQLDGQDQTMLAPLILRTNEADTRESPYQVRAGKVATYPKNLSSEKCLVLRPQPGDRTEPSPPTASVARDMLEKMLGPGPGVTGVKTMSLTVPDEQGVRQHCHVTFLVEFDHPSSASRALGWRVTIGQQVFRLDKLHFGPHRLFICRQAHLDGEARISRSTAVRSLLACFMPSTRLRIRMAASSTAQRTDGGILLVELSEGAEYQSFEFEVRSSQDSRQHTKLIFWPLDEEFETRCIACSSPAHSTTECPELRPVLLEHASALNPRLVATSRELSEAYEPDDDFVEEEGDEDDSEDDDNRALTTSVRAPLSQYALPRREDTEVKFDPQPAEQDPRGNFENARSHQSISDLRPAQRASVTLDDYIVGPFRVRNEIVISPVLKKPKNKLLLTVLSGDPIGDDLPALKALKAEMRKQKGWKAGVDAVQSLLPGKVFACFSSKKQVQNAVGRVIAMDNRSFTFDRFAPSHQRLFVCRGIPFGSDGVGQVPALHSLLQMLPDAGEVCVLLRKHTDTESRTWNGDLVVDLTKAQLIAMFSFELEIRGSRKNSREYHTLQFLPEDQGATCKDCTGGGRAHGIQHCPELTALLLEDGKGTHSRLVERPPTAWLG